MRSEFGEPQSRHSASLAHAGELQDSSTSGVKHSEFRQRSRAAVGEASQPTIGVPSRIKIRDDATFHLVRSFHTAPIGTPTLRVAF